MDWVYIGNNVTFEECKGAWINTVDGWCRCGNEQIYEWWLRQFADGNQEVFYNADRNEYKMVSSAQREREESHIASVLSDFKSNDKNRILLV